ncbi:alpha/beta hydrolase [candidate division KSB1 bacterium]|nr:alpha/beta hydrolase [candidate division KSB1 bacterium]
MWKFIILTILFIFTIFLISVANSWIRLANRKKNARFGSDRLTMIRNFKIHFVEFGEGLPLICLPDVWGGYRTWNPILPNLSREFHCICPDLMSIENRDPGSEFDFRPAKLANFFIDFLERLNLDTASYLGFGFSGHIILELAKHFPLRTGRSVIIEGFSANQDMRPNPQQSLLNILQIPVVGTLYHIILTSGWMSHSQARRKLQSKWNNMSELEKRNFSIDQALDMYYNEKSSFIKLLRISLNLKGSKFDNLRIYTPLLRLIGSDSAFYKNIEPTISQLSKIPEITQWIVKDSIRELHWQHPRWVAQVITHYIKEQNIFAEPQQGGIWQVEAT